MQMVGGVLAAGLVSAMFPGQLQAGSSLSDSTTPAQGFFIEMTITAELVMTIIMLAVVKSRASFMAPLSIGLALFIGHMIGTLHTVLSMTDHIPALLESLEGDRMTELYHEYRHQLHGGLHEPGSYVWPSSSRQQF